MKRFEPMRHTMWLVLSGAVAGAASVYAQDQVDDDRADIRIARGDTAVETLEQRVQTDMIRASELIGTELETQSGANVGEVADILTSTPGQGMHIVVAVGTEGLDSKTVAIPFDEVRVSADGDQLYTSNTRDQLAASPPVARNGRGVADIIGADVAGSDGESVGEVDDVVLSGANGTAQVVLQVGGIAGIGEKRIALPLDELQIDRVGQEEPQVRVAMTLDALEQQPEFSYR